MYIDVHCHLTGGEYEELGGVGEVIARAKADGVTRMICSGFDLTSSYIAKELSEKYPEIYFCAGFHPSELHKYQDGDLEKLTDLCSHEKCVAVGEIGLDYHFDDNPPREMQREFFIKQLQIANELGLPVVIHSRDAAQETLELLQANAQLLQCKGLMHCYSHSAQIYGPGRTIAYNPKSCAISRNSLISKFPEKTNCPSSGSCKFHAIYVSTQLKPHSFNFNNLSYQYSFGTLK